MEIQMEIHMEIQMEEMGVDHLVLMGIQMEILVEEVDHLVLEEILEEGVDRLVLVEILVGVGVLHHHLPLEVIQLYLHLEGEDDDLFIDLIEIQLNWRDSNLLLEIGELLLVLAKEREQFMMALVF